MLGKPLLLAIIAACGLSGAAAPAEQPDKKPPKEDVGDQHFCCTDVDPDKLTGQGCVSIGPENINSCDRVLYCEGNWAKKDGVVTCK